MVERAPVLRKTGGHAVDLFRPVMDISEHMGVIDRVLEHATGTKRLLIYRSGASRPADIDYVKLLAAASDRHVEIMRDDLSEIYYEAGRNDIVVGADGLHSGVRRLAFGDVEASRPPPRRRARSIPVPPRGSIRPVRPSRPRRAEDAAAQPVRGLGAYVLAGEMERAGGDYAAAFAAYEQVMSEPVIASRVLARTMAKNILPASTLGVWALVAAARFVSLLPTPITAAAARLNNKRIRLYDSMQVPDYPIPVA